MEKKIKEFVEEYNKRIDWNKDILGDIDADDFDDIKHFMDCVISTEKITEDEYDLENAKCYPYENSTLELQVFNNKTFGTSYFWVKPAESEDDYKEDRRQVVKREIDERLQQILPELHKITAQKDELLKLKEML